MPYFEPSRAMPLSDIGRIWRVAEALEYGIVGINEGIISPWPLETQFMN